MGMLDFGESVALILPGFRFVYEAAPIFRYFVARSNQGEKRRTDYAEKVGRYC